MAKPKQKLFTITVTHVDGTTTDTIVWGGDDATGQEQVALSTTAVTHPNGVKTLTIMWGT
jgi:hypothetical protein